MFGSGIIGLLAKVLLPDWKVVPFYRSRFFSYNPPLDDNFIIQDASIDPIIKDLVGRDLRIYQYRRAFSVGGVLIKEYNQDLCIDWLTKIFGVHYPNHALPYYSSRMVVPIYDVKVNQLYSSLISQSAAYLKEESAKGVVSEIGDHYYVQNKVRYDFDNAISTIPLNALAKLMGVSMSLEAKTCYFVHVRTDDLDFEGMNQILDTNWQFSFYKATNIAKGSYLLYFHQEVLNPGVYLMPILRKFDIEDGTAVPEAIPVGQLPKLDYFEARGISCIGSYAQWDYCADISSCILRILRYINRGYGPKKSLSVL